MSPAVGGAQRPARFAVLVERPGECGQPPAQRGAVDRHLAQLRPELADRHDRVPVGHVGGVDGHHARAGLGPKQEMAPAPRLREGARLKKDVDRARLDQLDPLRRFEGKWVRGVEGLGPGIAAGV